VYGNAILPGQGRQTWQIVAIAVVDVLKGILFLNKPGIRIPPIFSVLGF
jgi:hypothetical protein